MKNKQTIILFIVTIVSMLLGFIKEALIVNSMGISSDADIFIFASNLPILLFSSIGTILTTSFMPIYTEIRVNKNIDEANGYATEFLKYILLICFIVVLLGEVFPTLIVKILAPGLINYEVIKWTTRVMLPSVLILSILYTLNGILNSFGKVIITSSIQIPMHIILIFSSGIIYEKYGLEKSIMLILVGVILQLLLIYIPTKKLGFKLNKKTDITTEFLKKSLSMIAPMAIGAMAMQINSLIATNLASRVGEGSITIISLANKLYTASYSAVGYILVLLIFPILSELAAKKNINKMSEVLNTGIFKAIIFITPVMVLMILLSNDIVKFFFGNEKFGDNNINITAKILSVYTCSLIIWGVKDILNRAYYSLKETKISMINGIITVTINVIFSVLFIDEFGIIGLAMASSISSIISVMLLIKKLNIIGLKLDTKKLVYYMRKIIIIVVIISVNIILFKNKIMWITDSKLDQFVKLASISFITMLLYIVCIIVFFKKDVKEVFNRESESDKMNGRINKSKTIFEGEGK